MLENIIKAVINNWDPVNLFPNAPDNEYLSEIGKIYSFIKNNKNHNFNELGQKILEIFIESFGDDLFLETLEQCKEIAYEIDRNIKA